MTEIKVTTKNFDKLLEETDFNELDYVYFPVTMAGPLKGKFIYSILNQVLYATKDPPTQWQSGRSLNIHKVDNVNVGVRYTATTCYFYCNTETPSSWFTRSSQRYYDKIDDIFALKHYLSKLRTMRETFKELKRQEEILKQQTMFDKLVLKNMILDDCEYREDLISGDKKETDNTISIKLRLNETYHWSKSYYFVDVSLNQDETMNVTIPNVTIKNRSREEVTNLLLALKPFVNIELPKIE